MTSTTWKTSRIPPNPSYRIDPAVGQRWRSRVTGREVEIVHINSIGTEIKMQTIGSTRKPSTVHISTLRSRFTPEKP